MVSGAYRIKFFFFFIQSSIHIYKQIKTILAKPTSKVNDDKNIIRNIFSALLQTVPQRLVHQH